MKFEDALPRLVHLYEKGLLVPFLGAGMSIGACRGWEDLINQLERAEGRGGEAPKPGGSDASELIQRANRIARKLRYSGAGRFEDSLRAHLGTGQVAPSQTRELARIWWPLVLTTNYDNCFFSSFSERFPGMRIRGRSPHDCQRVLTSLTSPSVPILWALQGYLATPCQPAPRDDKSYAARLGSEVVFGHEEYRRVTHKEPHFRRAFAEVYRSRSLLFLGSGLRDPYLLELFGEVLENLGPNPFPHYAFVIEGGADVDFLRTRLNTLVISYADHRQLPDMLQRLQEALAVPRVRQMRWTYSTRCGAKLGADTAEQEELELVRGDLPRPAEGECVAVSVDRGDELPKGYKHLYPLPGALPRLPLGATVAQVDAQPLFLVGVRKPKEGKGAQRAITGAMTELLDKAQGFSRLRVQLLASGKGADFSPRYALVEMIRAFAAWRRATGSKLKVSIHLLDPNVLFSVATGRLDVPELLTCEDLRFWVQLVSGGAASERQLYFASPQQRLGDLVSELDLTPAWWVEISPVPGNENGGKPLEEVMDHTLEELGLVPGATLRLLSSRTALKNDP